MIRLSDRTQSDTELLKSIRDQLSALRSENYVNSLKGPRSLYFLFGLTIGMLAILLFK
jgi:hypothetical protein